MYEHGTPRAPVGVPDPLWQVIGALLQPEPEARFRTATGARKALAAAQELLPEPGIDEEPVEVFDQIGPLPEGFGPAGPMAKPAADPVPSSETTGSFHLAPPLPVPERLATPPTPPKRLVYRAGDVPSATEACSPL